jgi:hypothetical protein
MMQIAKFCRVKQRRFFGGPTCTIDADTHAFSISADMERYTAVFLPVHPNKRLQGQQQEQELRGNFQGFEQN